MQLRITCENGTDSASLAQEAETAPGKLAQPSSMAGEAGGQDQDTYG